MKLDQGAWARFLVECPDGSFETLRSSRQDLTFDELGLFCKMRCMEWKEPGGAFYVDGSAYSNLALLVSDQCPYKVQCRIISEDEFVVGEFGGSVASQYNDVFEFLIHTMTAVPSDALHEVLVNLLVHRDYRLDKPCMINILDTRVEFVSPGSLLEGMTMGDVELGVAACRNQKLMDVFIRLGLAEGYGVGMPRIEESVQNSPDCFILS